MNAIYCPECGAEIREDNTTCPSCGYPLAAHMKAAESGRHSNPVVESGAATANSNSKRAGMVMCLIAIVCILLGISRVTNTRYRFYEQHLQECIEGQARVQWNADHATGMLSGVLSGTYSNLANDYGEMIAADRRAIWSYRVQAIGLCCAGAALLVNGRKKAGKK